MPDIIKRVERVLEDDEKWIDALERARSQGEPWRPDLDSYIKAGARRIQLHQDVLQELRYAEHRHRLRWRTRTARWLYRLADQLTDGGQ